MLKRKLCALVLLALSSWASAQQAPAPLAEHDRHEVIESLASQLQSRYVFPDAGMKLAAVLREREAAGAYASAKDGETFARVLAQDMRKLGDDGHFNVQYDPAMPATIEEEPPLPDAATIERGRREMAAYAYGIPVTHTNWEHVGVKPDIAVPAAGAKQAAYVAALEGLVATATDADAKAELRDALAKAKAGIVDAPVYTPRR